MKRIFAVGSLLCLSFLSALGQQPPAYSFGMLDAQLFVGPAKAYISAAERGESRGLAQIAQKYLDGEGAPQNYQEFGDRISAAAEQGDQWAQLMLGLACIAGNRGVPMNIVQAYMWSSLAEAGSDQYIALLARQQRNTISTEMSHRQIVTAQELARNWKPTRELAKNDHVEKHSRWFFWRR